MERSPPGLDTPLAAVRRARLAARILLVLGVLATLAVVVAGEVIPGRVSGARLADRLEAALDTPVSPCVHEGAHAWRCQIMTYDGPSSWPAYVVRVDGSSCWHAQTSPAAAAAQHLPARADGCIHLLNWH